MEKTSLQGVTVNRTVFYQHGGGQPGDSGTLVRSSGERLVIVDTRKDRPKGDHWHLLLQGAQLPKVGVEVSLQTDWPRRPD